MRVHANTNHAFTLEVEALASRPGWQVRLKPHTLRGNQDLAAQLKSFGRRELFGHFAMAYWHPEVVTHDDHSNTLVFALSTKQIEQEFHPVLQSVLRCFCTQNGGSMNEESGDDRQPASA